MTYLINPWYFYIASFADNLQNVMIAIVVLSLIAIICFSVGWFYYADNDDYFDSNKSEQTLGMKFFGKGLKKSIIAAIISTVFLCIIPSETTINKMLIASCVTKENIAEAQDGVKGVIDYIVEKATELKKKSE